MKRQRTDGTGRRPVATTSAGRRLGSGRIDNRVDLGNPVRGKTALPGVFANQFLVGPLIAMDRRLSAHHCVGFDYRRRDDDANRGED